MDPDSRRGAARPGPPAPGRPAAPHPRDPRAARGTPPAPGCVRPNPPGRGWYTGAAGWLGPDLDGELWVLLRCAQIRGRSALLQAGAGIVAGSDPQAEWRETEAKLAAMLTALQYA